MSGLPRRIATLFGVGLFPKAPGTWGSLATIPLAWALHALGGFPLTAVATAALFVVGVWASGVYAAQIGRSDPPEAVIDEAVGMLIALWPLSLGLWLMEVPSPVYPWPGWALGFAAFRFFDILKPPPIRWVERLPGGWGIMLDDVVAGVMAALVASIAAALAHGALL
jgi:phosphatidylglycerophosphatase A